MKQLVTGKQWNKSNTAVYTATPETKIAEVVVT